MKLLSLGIWSWDAEFCPWDWVSSEARPTHRACGWATGALGLPGMQSHPKSQELWRNSFWKCPGNQWVFLNYSPRTTSRGPRWNMGPARADRANGRNVTPAGRPGDVTWHLFLCLQTSFWRNNVLLQFGDGDSRNCCWNRDKRNQELLNSLLSVGPHAITASRMSPRWLEEA